MFFSIAIIALLCAVIILVFRWRKRDVAANYAYDRRTGYRFPTFGNTEVVPVEVDVDGFHLDPLGMRWDTALLELDLEAAAPLFGGCPCIEMSIGPISFLHAVEHGAAGRRYLDISPVVVKAANSPSVVALKGKHVRWRKQTSRILLFNNELLMGKRLLVVAPHPDDGEIAAFGLQAAAESSVVTITAGDGGRETYGAIVDDRRDGYRLKAELRVAESIAVPGLSGIGPDRVMNLGYFDSTLKKMHLNPGEPVVSPTTGVDDITVFRRGSLLQDRGNGRREATWHNLVEDLREIIAVTKPDIIVAPHPILDSHEDHRFSFLAVLQALNGEASRCSFHLYMIHGNLAQNYPFGGSDCLASLPPWFRDDVPFEGVRSYLLSPLMRARKLIALDAMSDLRPAPMFHDTRRGVQRLKQVLLFHGGNPDFDRGFGRRRARFNELFFVYSFSGGAALTDYFHDFKPNS